MTPGVTVIETINEYASVIPLSWFIGSGVITVLICILKLVTEKYTRIQKTLETMITIGVIVFFICGIGNHVLNTDKITDTKYKVSVSDDVSLIEFYKHYDIIETDGTIFTIKKR